MKSSQTDDEIVATGLMARRGRLTCIDPAQISVAFNGAMKAAFYCAPCEQPLMALHESEGWWTCPLCGIEVTPAEQIEYAKLAVQGTKALLKDAKTRRGGWWQRRKA